MFILTTIAFHNTYNNQTLYLSCPNALLAKQALLFGIGNSLSDRGGANRDKKKDIRRKTQQRKYQKFG